MTQIKLRRDTSANFTSANPVLGLGEPAYETDTKKLKIGDGTTAYTQLEYFSAGGGGSTNISATLPLKIVDGVISLEVDGQTIQIVDGKLHANLDELGNEVNNLSGRVTAAEADILKKEDKLTPVAPITINKYVKSNLHGFSFTTDGTGVYTTSGKSLGYSNFPSQSKGVRVFEHNTLISSADESWACYIDIPISLGQVAKFPVPDANLYSNPMCILGKTDATGHFTVITHGYALSDNRCNPIDDALVFDGINVYTKNKLEYSSTSFSTNIVNNQDPYTGFVQLFEDEAGTFSIQIHKCYGASNGIPNYCTYKYVISDVSVINRFKEINTVRIVPFYAGTKRGETADSAIPVNSIGLYNCSTDLFSLNNDMSQFDTGNLFDISGETVHNYLELNIGSGLAITDGKLTASSTAPSNMVTTDTAQTITGVKTFDGNTPMYCSRIFLTSEQPEMYVGAQNKPLHLLGNADGNYQNGAYGNVVFSNNINDYIPQANATTLGGVKANPKTDDDTQEVKIDTATGLLYTQAGGGSAPTNMVTTDTAQTITGQKEFNHTILSLNQDLIRGQQSTSYRNGAGLSMGSNSTSTDGGVFAPQWKIYSTTGDVDRTETIITTHNQSKLSSTNFNTANKLVKLDSDGKLPAVDGSQLINLPGGGSAPSNMMTTDTAQTITGLKTFGGTDLSKILLEGSKSLIGFRANADSLPTTLIGGFFDSNGKKTITIGSTDHETLSLNAKSVQDGSGNKFLTSSDKETIMGYIMPDYSTRTAVPWDTDNTAPTDGYVEVMGEGDGRSSAFVLEYTINGVRTAVSGCYATAANTNFRLPVICPKGTVYRATKGAVMHELHFISMKGAV